ncbi:MAG: hypothetical protein O2894_09245 [Planctomycetota bacterium]|nr:hypothetical protein [Planctomycetota bacterium]
MNRVVMILIAVVLVGAAGVVTMWFGAGRDMQAPAVAFLMECKEGRFADVHARAHPGFREDRSVEQLAALWQHWEHEYGVFGEVIQRMGIGVAPDGETAWSRQLTLDLGFYKGHVLGRFFFMDVEGEPQLRHVWLEHKPTVQVEADERDALEPAARALFAQLGEGNLVGLYSSLAPALQLLWSQARLESELSTLREGAGALGVVTLTRTVEEASNRVAQYYDVAFANGPLEFKVTHEHDRGQWWVIGFKAR